MQLSGAQRARWDDDGWLILERALGAAEIEATRPALGHLFPGGAADAVPTWDAAWPEFPFRSRSLNALVVHDTVIDLAQQLLGTDDVVLYEALLSAKFPGQPSGFNQLLHADYPNHTMLVPRRDTGYQHVETYLYLCDVSEANGATRLLSQAHTRDIPVERHSLDIGEYAELYRRDVAAAAPAGSVVAYGPQVYHRSVDRMEEGQARYMLHVAYRPRRAQWIGYQAWPFKGLSAEWCDFVQGATPRQLLAVGFPPAGDPYWNEETLDGVQRRYPGLDMTYWR